MSNVVQFVSRPEAAACENLEAFIRLARDELTAFENGGAWESLNWREGKLSITFCKHRPRVEARHTPVPLAEPFLAFAKAYVRYRYGHRPVTSCAPMLNALRMIELALLDATGGAELGNLNVSVLDLSARHCSETYGKDVQYMTGRQIEAVVDFCREHSLVAGLAAWSSPFRKQPILTESLTEDGERHRSSRLPSEYAMLALADLFAQADDTESQYFTSIMVLLMVAPSRISEVLALPVDCIGWDTDSDGVRQLYLRWRAAKGGGPMKKWVPAAMQSVVEEAVARLIRIGAPARAAAQFAHGYPGLFLQHEGLITPRSFGQDDELSSAEVAAAVGVRQMERPGWGGFPNNRWKRLRSGGPVTYRRLAEMVADLYKNHDWPYINAKKDVAIWDALCVVREFEYHRDFQVQPFSWRLPNANEVNARLGAKTASSLFEKAGMKSPDGAPIKLTTHQLRHWLSTMSARAGMDDYTLARWAGRARIEDNQHYDHRTQEERSDELRALMRKEQPRTLEKFKARLPVTYRELGVDRPGTAKATLYGMCVHDYAMTPCQKQRDCMTCKEHVCIKGDHFTLERIKQLEEMTDQLLRKALQASSDGDFGADRWVDHHKWKLAHVRTMKTLLEAESVPEGSAFRIPDEYDPSPVRRVLMDQDLIKTTADSDAPMPQAVLRIEGPTDA